MNIEFLSTPGMAGVVRVSREVWRVNVERMVEVITTEGYVATWPLFRKSVEGLSVEEVGQTFGGN